MSFPISINPQSQNAAAIQRAAEIAGLEAEMEPTTPNSKAAEAVAHDPVDPDVRWLRGMAANLDAPHLPEDKHQLERIAARLVQSVDQGMMEEVREVLAMFVHAAKPRRWDGYHEMPMFSAREIEIARTLLARMNGEG